MCAHSCCGMVSHAPPIKMGGVIPRGGGNGNPKSAETPCFVENPSWASFAICYTALYGSSYANQGITKPWAVRAPEPSGGRCSSRHLREVSRRLDAKRAP
jgi:hypothetical protein